MTSTYTGEPDDLVERLRKRAAEDRACATNSQVIVDALADQLRLFERRKGHNTYAVRVAVDHQSSVRRDTQYAETLEASAACIESLAQQIADAERLSAQNAELWREACLMVEEVRQEREAAEQSLSLCRAELEKLKNPAAILGDQRVGVSLPALREPTHDHYTRKE